MGRDWRKLARLVFDALSGVAAAAGTGYLAWVQHYPADGRPNWERASIATVGFVAIVNALGRPFRVYRNDQHAQREKKINTVLRGLTKRVAEYTGLPIEPLGANAWRAHGPFGRWRQLVRIGHERESDLPSPSLVRWTLDKGIIGRVWKDGQSQVVNTGELDDVYGDCDRATWNAAAPQVRKGLTFDEYRRIRCKYGTVIAMPMCKNEQVAGVVTLDAPRGVHDALDVVRVGEAVAVAAHSIVDLL